MYTVLKEFPADSVVKNLLAKRSDLVHWEDLEGAGGEGGGGGIWMGNTCKPMAATFQCMTKSTTNKNNNNKN